MFGNFVDAHAAAYADAGKSRPPTLIASNLDEHFLMPATDTSSPVAPTSKLLEALRRAWESLVGDGNMNRQKMEEWLVKINGELGDTMAAA